MCFFELQTTAKDYAKQSHEYFQLLCRLVTTDFLFIDGQISALVQCTLFKFVSKL